MPRTGVSTERLVRAAADLADEIGFEHVTLSALARHFGVQVASLYSHVRSLDDLRRHVALLALEEQAGRASVALAGRAGLDALRALGDMHRDYARTHPGRHDAARFPLPAETAAASAGPRLAAMTRAVLRDYALAEPDQTHATRLLGSVFHGFVTLEGSGAFSHSSPASEESWEQAILGLDRLLRTWPRT